MAQHNRQDIIDALEAIVAAIEADIVVVENDYRLLSRDSRRGEVDWTARLDRCRRALLDAHALHELYSNKARLARA